jgi:hypothetical protein
MLSFAHHIVDRIQHLILVGPEGLVWEVVQVHKKEDIAKKR